MNGGIIVLLVSLAALCWLRRAQPFSYRVRHRLAIVALFYLIFSPAIVRGVAIGQDQYVIYFILGGALWLGVSIGTGCAERDAEGRLLPTSNDGKR